MRRLVLGLVMLALGPTCRAAESSCGPYRVGLYMQSRLLYTDGQGRLAGIDKDIAEGVARRSGCILEPVVESRVRIWEQMRRGSLHITTSAIPSPERETFAEFVPYSQARAFLLMRREPSAALKSLDDFTAKPGLQVVVVKGYIHGKTLDAWLQVLRAQGRVIEAADFSAAGRMFRHGRADAMISNPVSWGEVLAGEDDFNDIAVLDWVPKERAVGALALARSLPAADRQRLCRAMDAMVRDGSVEAILVRHLGERAARLARYSPVNRAPGEGCG